MRSIVQQHIGDLKTESSGKSIPLDEDLIAELLAWRKETPYAAALVKKVVLKGFMRQSRSGIGTWH